MRDIVRAVARYFLLATCLVQAVGILLQGPGSWPGIWAVAVAALIVEMFAAATVDPETTAKPDSRRLGMLTLAVVLLGPSNIAFVWSRQLGNMTNVLACVGIIFTIILAVMMSILLSKGHLQGR